MTIGAVTTARDVVLLGSTGLDRPAGDRRRRPPPGPVPGQSASPREGDPGRRRSPSRPPRSASGPSPSPARRRRSRCARALRRPRREPASGCSPARTPRPSSPAAAPTSSSTGSPARSACGPPWPRCGAGSAARPGEQGVAHRRRPAGQRRGAGPGRSSRSTPSTPRIAQCLRSGARATRCAGSCSPRAAARSAAAPAPSSRDVTPEQALAHPTWAMGPVVTTNSATLVNKGLEVIEAHLLFGVAVRPDRRRGPPAVDRALDGRVHRRFDASPRAPRRTCGCRSRSPRLARPGARTPRPRSTGPRPRRWDVRAARRRRLPRGAPRAAGRGGRRHVSCRLQRGERGVRRGLPRRPDPVPRHRRHGRARASPPTSRCRGRRRWTTSSRADTWARERGPASVLSVPTRVGGSTVGRRWRDRRDCTLLGVARRSCVGVAAVDRPARDRAPACRPSGSASSAPST